MCRPPRPGRLPGMVELRQLIKDAESAGRGPGDVFVRTPRRGGLTKLLTGMGATVHAEPGGGLAVTGMDAPAIALAASRRCIPIHELTPRGATPPDSARQPARRSVGHRSGAARPVGVTDLPELGLLTPHRGL
jgi:hypothetical protein